jgi:hypothetical protein
VLLPSVCAAAGFWPDGGAERAPERRRGEGVAPVSQAAVVAADDPGTEVAAARVAGSERGQAGRWAMLLRRRRQPLPDVEARHPVTPDEPAAAAQGEVEAAAGPDDTGGLDGVPRDAVSQATDSAAGDSSTHE